MNFLIKPVIPGQLLKSLAPLVCHYRTATICGSIHTHNSTNGHPGYISFTSGPQRKIIHINNISNYSSGYSKLVKDYVNINTCTVSSLCKYSTKQRTSYINTFSQQDFSTCTQKDRHHSPFQSNSISKRVLTPITCNTEFHRELSLSPKKILDASPPSVQPYMRLMRFDKPIGE